jgi:hypothetical protein
MDIRTPIGLIFTIIGVLLTVFGFFTRGADMYRHSLGINMNIWSGVCLLVFGLLMLIPALRAQRRSKDK